MKTIIATLGVMAMAGAASAEDTHCWKHLDANDDRAITPAEVMAVLTPEASESLQFLHLERDHDGGISTAELEAGKAQVSASDTMIDVDGNGTMSAAEVAATIEAARLTAMIPPETRMDRWKKKPAALMAALKKPFQRENEQSELVTMLLACKGHAAPLSTLMPANI